MSNHPQRVQRKRTKGFNLQTASPNGLPVVYVGRPTAFGNPFLKTEPDAIERYESYITCQEPNHPDRDRFKHHQTVMRHLIERDLRGKNLACFCSLDSPCHADVLLRLANLSAGEATI